MKIDAVSSANSVNYGTTEVRSTTPSVETTQKVSESTAANAAPDYTTRAKDDAEETAKNGNKPSESTIKQAISDINKKINPNTIAEYGYHDDTNRVTIKIVDKDTDDVIKEYPAEETLDMIAKVWELAGMFVDEKG